MRKQAWLSRVGLLTASALLWAEAVAQPLPPQLDPGAAQRRSLEQREALEEIRPREETVEDPVDVEPPEQPAVKAPDGARFELKGARINESAFLDREELATLIRAYVGREVGFPDLQRLVQEINGLYRAQGVATALAILPPQQIENGVVRIQLVEGRLGGVEFTGNVYTRESFLRRRLPLQVGEVVDARRLQDALIHFNRTSEIQLQAALRPGEAFGLTDVRVGVQEPPRNSVQIFFDNLGVESTGEYQAGLFARRNGLFGWDDRLALYLVGSEGTLTGSLSYGIPVTASNGRLSLSYAANDLEIIKGPFKDLKITGDSSTFMLGYDHPLHAGLYHKWDLHLAAVRSKSETEISGFAFSESEVTKASVGFSYEYSGRKQRVLTSHALSWAEVDSSTDTRWSSYIAYTGSLNWYRALWDCCTGAVHLGWQYLNDDQAPASELFQIGGPGSVRGYVQGVVAGTRGYYAQLELHRPLIAGLAGLVFFDAGAVMPDPDERISSIGLGVNYRYGRWLSFNVTYGHTLKDVVPNQDSGRFDARLVLNFGF